MEWNNEEFSKIIAFFIKEAGSLGTDFYEYNVETCNKMLEIQLQGKQERKKQGKEKIGVLQGNYNENLKTKNVGLEHTK